MRPRPGERFLVIEAEITFPYLCIGNVFSPATRDDLLGATALLDAWEAGDRAELLRYTAALNAVLDAQTEIESTMPEEWRD